MRSTARSVLQLIFALTILAEYMTDVALTEVELSVAERRKLRMDEITDLEQGCGVSKHDTLLCSVIREGGDSTLYLQHSTLYLQSVVSIMY